MNVFRFIVDSLLIPGGAYLFWLFISQYFILGFFKLRYSKLMGMNEFLSRYTRFKRINFEEDESVSLAYIQKKHAYAWGMMGMGMMAIFYSWQSISKNESNWFLIVAALLVPSLHGFFRASSYFAARCFSELGIFSFSEPNEKK